MKYSNKTHSFMLSQKHLGDADRRSLYVTRTEVYCLATGQFLRHSDDCYSSGINTTFEIYNDTEVVRIRVLVEESI